MHMGHKRRLPFLQDRQTTAEVFQIGLFISAAAGGKQPIVETLLWSLFGDLLSQTDCLRNSSAQQENLKLSSNNYFYQLTATTFDPLAQVLRRE